MTFNDLKQAVYDIIGVTDTTGITGRIVNEAVNQIRSHRKWPWLEESFDQLLTSDTNEYSLSTTIGAVMFMQTSTGVDIEMVDRHIFRDLYKGSTSTAANPTKACIQGIDSTNALQLIIWPTPSANSTAKLWGERQVADMSTDADVPQIPFKYHQVIVKGAVSRYFQRKGGQEAQQAEQEFQQALLAMEVAELGPVMADKTG
jgi:hypothetical protein